MELLIHEVSRVFFDRLVTENDRDFFHQTMLDQLYNFLKTKWSKGELSDNCAVFGDYFETNVPKQKRVYTCIRDKKKLMQIIEVGNLNSFFGVIESFSVYLNSISVYRGG